MRPPTARELDSIDANLESAWRFATRSDPEHRVPIEGAKYIDAYWAIAHALLAIAQCARIAIADGNAPPAPIKETEE